MNIFECFADDCSFITGERTAYARHLFDVHTEDQEGVDRHQVVDRIMDRQGYNAPWTGGVSGGMRRVADAEIPQAGDVW